MLLDWKCLSCIYLIFSALGQQKSSHLHTYLWLWKLSQKAYHTLPLPQHFIQLAYVLSKQSLDHLDVLSSMRRQECALKWIPAIRRCVSSNYIPIQVSSKECLVVTNKRLCVRQWRLVRSSRIVGVKRQIVKLRRGIFGVVSSKRYLLPSWPMGSLLRLKILCVDWTV